MDHWKNLAFVAILILIAPTFVSGFSVAEKEIKNETISYEDHYTDWLYGVDKDDKLKVTGTASKPIDIYIISNDNFWSGYSGTSGFTPVFEKQNVTNLAFEWTCPDDQLYVLVFDNEFNGEGADPSGSVTISYSRNEPSEEAAQEAFNFFCALVIVIIIVAIILVIYLVIRRKKKKEEAQAPKPHPQQYQQPYQQQTTQPQYPSYQQPQPPPPQQQPPQQQQYGQQQPPQYPPQY